MSSSEASGVRGGPTAAAPLFSVLVASYNQEQYILETLDSVADQTFDDYELIVVNDGSTDDTEPRVREWVENFRRRRGNRVEFVTTPNRGQSAALEHAFELARGRYACLLDSDDRWLPEKLERVARAAEADPDAGMIVHPLFVIDARGSRTGDVRPKRAKLSVGDLRAEMRRTGRHVAPACSGVVIRAEVFRQLVPMPTKVLKFGADGYLTFGASLLAPVRAIAEPLGEYRMQPDGQYIRLMSSPEGLARQIDLQLVIARHFDLEEVVRRNSFFARNVFARAKFTGSPREKRRAFHDLLRATLADPSFSASQKTLLTGYWVACMLSPVPVFARLWRAFQVWQTGFNRLDLQAVQDRVP